MRIKVTLLFILLSVFQLEKIKAQTIQNTRIHIALFVPLYLERGEQTIHSWELLEIILTEGDALYLTMPATELYQLWRTATPTLGDSSLSEFLAT
jgi:hypothetical protein